MPSSAQNSFTNQQRYIFSGNVPLYNTTLAQPHNDYVNTDKCEFTENYRGRLSSEWSPIRASRPDPPLMQQASEIHHRSVGHLPNYAGYIPGAIFRNGTTYGKDSRDGKRWIRGDFTF